MPDLVDPVTLAVPAFILLIIAEMVFARATGRAQFEPRDSLTSLLMGVGNMAFGSALAFITLAWFTFVSQFKMFDIGWVWWAWIVCFVADDFVYYWWHRAAHRVRWFWANHVIHHSSQHYNLTTALRQPWFGPLSLAFVFFGTWLIVIGFPIAMVAFVGALNLVYQFWIHTEVVRRMPSWFEAVFNTPSHHRVHHATNPRYLDSNYAGVFIVWDRMFGTFAAERADEPCRYGIVRNLGTFNPITVATHEYVGIIKDIGRSSSVGEAMGYLLRPPGWTPDGSRDTSDTIKAKWRARQLAANTNEAAARDVQPAE